MVAEEYQDADEEHGRHDKQKQDVKFSVRVRLLFSLRGKENKRVRLVSRFLCKKIDCRDRHLRMSLEYRL